MSNKKTKNNEYEDHNSDDVDSLSDVSSVSSDEETESEEGVAVSKTFQENVIKYVKLDDIIVEKDKEVQSMKKQRKTAEEYIIKSLDKLGEDKIDISDGKLKMNKTKNKVGISEEIIKESLTKNLQGVIDGKMDKLSYVKSVMDGIDNRPKKEKITIKRSRNRPPKKTKKQTENKAADPDSDEE
jgi:hypothetical protein